MQALYYKVQSQTGNCFGASFAVQSSTGEYFVQAFQYKVILGVMLRKLCNTNSTGKFLVQAL